MGPGDKDVGARVVTYTETQVYCSQGSITVPGVVEESWELLKELRRTTWVYTHTHTYSHTHTHTYIVTHIHTYLHKHIFTHTYSYTHPHKHTHLETY